MNGFKCSMALAAGLMLGCSPDKQLTFDIEYGFFETFMREPVGAQGQLTCQVRIDENRRGEKWVPSVILAAAEDDKEDSTLFLSSYPVGEGTQRVFALRTLVDAKPVIREWPLTGPNRNDRYGLRVAWHADGSISYQMDNGEGWSAPATVREPGFKVRHVSAHASGVKGNATCRLSDDDTSD